MATKGDIKSARLLAREIVRADKQVDRLSVSRAQLGSIDSQLQQQLGASSCGASRRPADYSPYSHGEGHWYSAKVDGNHEALQPARATTPVQSDHARDEHGDDQSESL
jgi:hypothetical protein